MRTWWGGIAKGLTVAAMLVAAPVAAQPALDADVTLPMPAGVSPDRVVLWASGPLVVEHDVTITGDGTSVAVAMPTPTASTAELRVSARSQAEHLHSAHPITIDRARITGDARSAGAITLLGGAQVDGALVPFMTFASAAGVTIDVAFPAGSLGAVYVAPNATRSLAPGRYLGIEVAPGGRLLLGAGSYYVESLKTAPDAQLVIADDAEPVKLFVRGDLQHRGQLEVASGSGASFLAVVLGTTCVVERRFTGALIAPNAALRLGGFPGATFIGSFFGRALVVREHSVVRHVASPLVWRPRIPFSDATLSARTCPAFLELDPSGEDVRYVANPTCPVRFCDANEQPIPTPTEAMLNDPTVTPVACPAIGAATTDCPIDPGTVTTACTTSADCAPDERCGERCIDALCTQIELRCGQLAASCGGLPAGGACDPREWRECGDPLDRGTVSLASLQQQLYLQDGPQPGAYIPVAMRLNPPGTYADVDTIDACGFTNIPTYPALSSEAAPRSVVQGNATDWNVTIEPNLRHFVDLQRRDLADGSFQVGGEASLRVAATVRGEAVVPLEAVARATADRCGVRTVVSTTLFGQIVDVPELFNGAGGLAEIANDVLGTPPALADACRARRTTRTAKARIAKPALVLARQVQKFVRQFGTPTDLCERTKQLLGPAGLPVDCTALAVLTDLSVAETWRALYDQAVEELAAAERATRTAETAISVEDEILLADEGEEFDKVIIHASIGLGPLSLTVQLRAVGSWQLAGKLEYRVAITGGTPSLVSGISSFPPLDGDVRATAGPTLSAHLDVALVAFVGAGIPDYAAVGVEGSLELVDATASFDAVAALMLISEPDPRDLAASDWAGDPIPDIPVDKVFRWVHGWAYAATAALSVLDGTIDLVARIGVKPFQLSHRENLVKWEGARWEATLVDGDPAAMRDDFGAFADSIALTRVPPSTAPASPPVSNLALDYPHNLYDPRLPCGGPN